MTIVQDLAVMENKNKVNNTLTSSFEIYNGARFYL